jgi:hypothetical protein
LGLVFCKSSNTGLILKTTFPDLEDDFQFFHDEESRESEIFDLVCAARSLEKVDKINIAIRLE